MTNNDQATESIYAVSTKDTWVKPEITSFAAAVEAQGEFAGCRYRSERAA